jgi:uncharacterized protein YjeT (DUF2065 family)
MLLHAGAVNRKLWDATQRPAEVKFLGKGAMRMPYYLSATVIVALVLVSVGIVALYYGYRARRRSSDKEAKSFHYSRLLGIGSIALGIVLYTWEVMAPLTAEKIVERERSQYTLPMNINDAIRWESIEAGDRRVTYVYLLRKTPRGISERFALIAGLRQQITDYLCGDRLYRAAIKQHISFELIYKFLDETYPPITLSPGECAP